MSADKRFNLNACDLTFSKSGSSFRRRTPRVRLLLPDEQTTHHYAALFAQLRTRATPIPTNDIWIAALVIQHGLTLVDRDRHFDQLAQLSRL